ncbi:MAG: type IV pili methyl-accepting chemotaxis transducer N-terminal domain-containing protein, partial [Geminicoccaceae bacterium]
MSFLNKLPGWGHKSAGADANSEAELAFEGGYSRSRRPALSVAGSSSAAGGLDLALPDVHHGGFEPSQLSHEMNSVQSIISEAEPSDSSDSLDSRHEEAAARVAAAPLPLIGKRPIAEQQRILYAVVIVSLVLLVGLTTLSVIWATRGSAQVAASGQALMQSQRLAKSVSQALIGSPQAFPEVRESAQVLGRNVRGLKTGEGDIAAAPGNVHPALDGVLPLAEKAEKNAATVLAQEKILTQIGQALRGINRQSSDMLDVAETVSSLKVQRDAAPSELLAIGQLIMLTQRIGKSANEFLTTDGVSDDA